MYIYPDHLKAKATMWLWQTGILVPALLTAAYAFLTIRFEDTSILDFLCYASAYFFRQQFFEWRFHE